VAAFLHRRPRGPFPHVGDAHGRGPWSRPRPSRPGHGFGASRSRAPGKALDSRQTSQLPFAAEDAV